MVPRSSPLKPPNTFFFSVTSEPHPHTPKFSDCERLAPSMTHHISTFHLISIQHFIFRTDTIKIQHYHVKRKYYMNTLYILIRFDRFPNKKFMYYLLVCFSSIVVDIPNGYISDVVSYRQTRVAHGGGMADSQSGGLVAGGMAD
jgi:hypothetical protein